MPLVVDFSASQVIGNETDIILTDASTGSDGTITQRRVYVQKADGDYMVEDGTATEYEVWGDFPATSTITLNLLDKDYAVKITVQWLTAGNVVVYDYIRYYGFTLYNETFDYGLTQLLTANPLIINDNNFLEHKFDVRALIDSGNNAVSFAEDITNAQMAYDRATELRFNSKYYFNTNT